MNEELYDVIYGEIVTYFGAGDVVIPGDRDTCAEQIAKELEKAGYRKADALNAELTALTAKVEVLQSERDNLMRTIEESPDVIEETKRETVCECSAWLHENAVVMEEEAFAREFDNAFGVEASENAPHGSTDFLTEARETQVEKALQDFHEWAAQGTRETKAAENLWNLAYFMLFCHKDGGQGGRGIG